MNLYGQVTLTKDRYGQHRVNGGRPAPNVRLAMFLARLLLRVLSGLVKTDKRIWIFGLQDLGPAGMCDFKDNSKYMFLYLCNKSNQVVRPIWLTCSRQLAAALRRRGYEVYYIASFMGIKSFLKAGCILSHTGFSGIRAMLVGRMKVDLWHGVPLKKLAESNAADYVCATSESLREHFGTCVGVDPAKVVVSGYPRTDVLFSSIPGYEIGLEAHLEAIRALKKRARIVLYTPTFRDYLEEATFEEFFKEIPLNATELDSVLETHGAFLLIKLHDYIRNGRIEHALERISERVYVISEPIDVYPILREADVLVTDYSSIFFDFLLLDRPIVFYIPDYDMYRRTRGFSLEFESFTPGPKASTFGDLVTALRSVLEGEDAFKDERRRVREYVFDYVDANSSERVFRWLMGVLNLGLHLGTIPNSPENTHRKQTLDILNRHSLVARRSY